MRFFIWAFPAHPPRNWDCANLAVPNDLFCNFYPWGGFLFKKNLQKAGKVLLIKKIAITFAKQKRGISSSG